MATKTIILTKDWQQVADGDCTVQTPNFSGDVCVRIGAGGDDGLILALDEPVNLQYGQVVYVKLGNGYVGKGERVVVVQ